MSYRYIFGPVASRRLGRSLGIDLFEKKICSFDCLYCEVEKTLVKTLERKEWVDTKAVKSELKRYLDQEENRDLDYITFSGSGEPTLHSKLGEIIDFIHSITDIKVAVLTNSSLINQRDVWKDLAKADLIVPSLDAPNQEVFEMIDLPCEGLSLDTIIQGLIDFRAFYPGLIWLEIMVLEGINDSEEIFKEFARLIPRMKPDRVQLNMLDRPPAYDLAKRVSDQQLKRLKKIIGSVAELV